VYPANLWAHKNHERLIAAFERVDDDSLHLVLTGRFYGREAQLSRHERVHVLGYVALERLASIYRGAVAMVFPSLFEGFGLPVLESMACGTPVGCSDRGALAEVADDAACQFDPTDVDAIADAIRRITADSALRERLRAAGLLRARHFSWEACAASHLEVYRTAAGQRE
jgi:glycosyltransferase involved in cell wall biosynthesis